MKAVVAAFNQEKALVGAFSVIVQLHQLIDLRHYLESNYPFYIPHILHSSPRVCHRPSGIQVPSARYQHILDILW